MDSLDRSGAEDFIKCPKPNPNPNPNLGLLDSLDRNGAEDFIKCHGGRVTGSVSGKTTYLLVGSVLEDGRAVDTSKKHKVRVGVGVGVGVGVSYLLVG